MITITHARPDGTPLRAECSDCPQEVWTPELDVREQAEVLRDLTAYIRCHLRVGRYGTVPAYLLEEFRMLRPPRISR